MCADRNIISSRESKFSGGRGLWRRFPSYFSIFRAAFKLQALAKIHEELGIGRFQRLDGLADTFGIF